jgi:hypothetical protein
MGYSIAGRRAALNCAPHGYCLLYPTTHEVERPKAAEVNLVVGSLLNATDPRASIRVITGDGLTAESFADDIVASFEGFDVTRSERNPSFSV